MVSFGFTKQPDGSLKIVKPLRYTVEAQTIFHAIKSYVEERVHIFRNAEQAVDMVTVAEVSDLDLLSNYELMKMYVCGAMAGDPGTAAVLHIAVVYGFWPADFFKKRGNKAVVRDWCDLQGSRLRLLGSYLIRLSQRLAEVQVLKRLLFTIRGISLELVDSPRALGTEEVDADDVVSVGSDSDDGLEMVGEKKSDDPVELSEKLSSKPDEVAATSSSSKEGGTVGTFKDREPLFVSGSYLTFDAKDAEALHLEDPGTTGLDIRDEQRKLRASCRKDKAVVTLQNAAKKSKDPLLVAALKAHAERTDEPAVCPPPAETPDVPSDVHSPVGSQTGGMEVSSPHGDIEPPATQPSPNFSPEPTPRYHHTMEPMMLKSPVSTPFSRTGRLDSDLSPVRTPYKEMCDGLPLPRDLNDIFEDSLPAASMEPLQSPMKLAAQQDPYPARSPELQMVISDVLEECEDQQDDSVHEDEPTQQAEGPSRRRKERASLSTPVKPDTKKAKKEAKRMAREAKSKEAWAEIKALAVETIPDVVPAGGRKKETTMILVGR
ncbi:unnamed protein product [Symbiodinium microadriaticum]|nr:unnamed protein product [Symbiodinium microadriaticum]